MSGGYWNYQNYILGNVASDIKEIIEYNDKNNDYKKNVSDDNNKIDNDWNKPNFERLYPKTVIDCMKAIYPLLKLADDAVYINCGKKAAVPLGRLMNCHISF